MARQTPAVLGTIVIAIRPTTKLRSPIVLTVSMFSPQVNVSILRVSKRAYPLGYLFLLSLSIPDQTPLAERHSEMPRKIL
jgi:hypothetical protein